jgi:uncharacterized metal-binding protein YceD (DUF177 family)
MTIAAAAEERAAVARRFGLPGLDRLEAALAISRNGEDVTVAGTLQADLVQACIASAAPVPAALVVPFDILFRPQPDAGSPDHEVELSERELDVVFYDGEEIDVGEAVAETLSLNLDPYPRSPEADAILREAGVKREGEEEKGPFAGLAALRDKLQP